MFHIEWTPFIEMRTGRFLVEIWWVYMLYVQLLHVIIIHTKTSAYTEFYQNVAPICRILYRGLYYDCLWGYNKLFTRLKTIYLRWNKDWTHSTFVHPLSFLRGLSTHPQCRPLIGRNYTNKEDYAFTEFVILQGLCIHTIIQSYIIT